MALITERIDSITKIPPAYQARGAARAEKRQDGNFPAL